MPYTRFMVTNSNSAGPSGVEGPQTSCLGRGVITYIRVADGAASTVTAQTVIGRVPAGYTWTITRVTVLAAANVTADGSHYKTITVKALDDADGSSSTGALASLDTSTTGLTANTVSEMTLVSALLPVASTTTVPTIEVTKTGNGVQLPVVTIVLEYQLLFT